MNEKRWFYLILLIIVFIIISIKQLGFIFSLFNFSNEPSYIFNSNNELIQALKRISEFGFYSSLKQIFGANHITRFMFNITASSLNFLFGIIFIKVYKMFFEQGSAAIKNDKINIIKNGILIYSITLGLVILFLTSVVGYGIAIILLLFALLIFCIGKISIYIYIGCHISDKNNIYIDMLIGYVIIETITNIPYIRVFTNIAVIIIAVGTIAQTITNLYFVKKFYEVPYMNYNKKKFDRNKIHDIIMSNDK